MSLMKYKSPFGTITIQVKDNRIYRVYLPNAEPDITENPAESTELLKKVKTQLDEYFGGKRKAFDLPLDFDNRRVFYKKVYDELLKIPYGETASYKQIAERAGSPKGYRSVGLANHKNPLPIIIPCHRVIGSDGDFTGYAGGTDMKIKLLELEKNNI